MISYAILVLGPLVPPSQCPTMVSISLHFPPPFPLYNDNTNLLHWGTTSPPLGAATLPKIYAPFAILTLLYLSPDISQSRSGNHRPLCLLSFCPVFSLLFIFHYTYHWSIKRSASRYPLPFRVWRYFVCVNIDAVMNVHGIRAIVVPHHSQL